MHEHAGKEVDGEDKPCLDDFFPFFSFIFYFWGVCFDVH